jgi:hypothetical protein
VTALSGTYTIAPPPGPVSLIALVPEIALTDSLFVSGASKVPPIWKLSSMKPSVAPGAWRSATTTLPLTPKGEKKYESAWIDPSVTGAWMMFVWSRYSAGPADVGMSSQPLMVPARRPKYVSYARLRRGYPSSIGFDVGPV